MPITPADTARETHYLEAYEYLRNWILENCGPVAALNAQRAWEREVERRKDAKMRRARDMAYLYRQGMSTAEVGRQYGLSGERVRQLLERYNQARRTFSEAAQWQWRRRKAAEEGH